MQGRDAVVAALLLWVVVVAVFDWRQRRVPNWTLLVVLFPAALAVLVRGEGLLGATPIDSLFGACVGGGLLMPGYLSAKLGAGDVKLAAVHGVLLGVVGVLQALLLSALLLGLISLLVLVGLGLRRARGLRLPAAVALGGGFVAAMLLSQWSGA